MTYKNLADIWNLRYSATFCDPPDETRWVYNYIYDNIRNKPDEGWTIIKEFSKSNLSEVALANFAAGPVEDFINWHGQRYIDEIMHLCKNSERFKEILEGVWLHALVNPDVKNKIIEAIG